MAEKKRKMEMKFAKWFDVATLVGETGIGLSVGIKRMLLSAFTLCSVPALVLAEEGAPQQRMHSTAFWTTTVFYVLIGWAVVYLLIIRPAKLKEDQTKAFVQGLKKGDEVLVLEGIIGRVVAIKPEFITVDIGQDLKVKVLPTALVARNTQPAPAVEKSVADKS